MTERREWWTDDLIEAVRNAPRQRILNDEQTYAVIAAVEDWQGEHPEAYIDRDIDSLRTALIQLQAVRDALDSNDNAYVTKSAIRRALDGA